MPETEQKLGEKRHDETKKNDFKENLGETGEKHLKHFWESRRASAYLGVMYEQKRTLKAPVPSLAN